MSKNHEDLRTCWTFFGVEYHFAFPVTRRYAMMQARISDGIKLRRNKRRLAA